MSEVEFQKEHDRFWTYVRLYYNLTELDNRTICQMNKHELSLLIADAIASQDSDALNSIIGLLINEPIANDIKESLIRKISMLANRK